MTIDFDSLIQRQTIADARAAVVTSAGVVNWLVETLPPLSRLRKLALDVVPVLIYNATRINAEAIRGGLLDYATGVWVDLIATNLFGLDGRIEETFATTAVAFTNASAEPYAFAAGEVRVGNGAVEFTNMAPFTLAPMSSVSADVIATIVGTDGNADANTITTMITTFDGVACTNPAAARGNDRETDDALKVRCRLARSALSNSGPEDAIKLVCLSAKRVDGTAIGVTRVQVVNDDPNLGDVSVYLADADGPIADDDVDRIDYLLRTLVIPSGINYLGTFPADTVTVAITYSARARTRDGFTEAEIEAFVEEAINELFATYPIGGYVGTGPEGTFYRTELSATISQAQSSADNPRPIVDVTLALPAADVTLDPGELAIPGTITPTVTFVRG